MTLNDHQVHSGRSDIERPLLMVTSSSDDRLEETGASKTNVEDQGHSNPLMASSDLGNI